PTVPRTLEARARRQREARWHVHLHGGGPTIVNRESAASGDPRAPSTCRRASVAVATRTKPRDARVTRSAGHAGHDRREPACPEREGRTPTHAPAGNLSTRSAQGRVRSKASRIHHAAC